MADTSPGKVQALTAMFAQKDVAVMGLMPGKLGPRPWKTSSNTSLVDEDSTAQDSSPISCAATRAILKTLQESACDKDNRKPTVGPKPTFIQKQRTMSNPALKITRSYENSAPKKYDAIASFMFADSVSNLHGVVKDETTVDEKKLLPLNTRLNLINSDNYICKSSYGLIRNELPTNVKCRPPPLKPPRPSHLKLPERYVTKDSRTALLPPVPAYRPNTLSLLSSTDGPRRPKYPCPPRPSSTPPAAPPKDSPPNLRLNQTKKTLLEEIEELYEDTLLQGNRRPVSLIPEYTAEEELYDDADQMRSSIPSPERPKYPPPPLPTLYLNPLTSAITEELYQDAVQPITEEVYEEMPVGNLEEDLYSNNKKEFEKMKREEEKRCKKEVKEREKREREFDKIKKKFRLTGEELPIDTGLVKMDSRGSRTDLAVKKGDTVYILRIEGNPAGRWLVRNKKGKYGFVELTNIEVDPDSVKSVMTIRRTSVISGSEELYSEAYSDEGIYEITY